MAGKQLKTLVTVHDEQGVAHLFGPNDALPDWAREKISNPNVWDGDDAAETLVPTPPAPPAPPADEPDGDESGDAPDTDDEHDDVDKDSADETDGVVTDGAPPRSGTGSGIKNWKTWADEQGVQYPSDISRDDLIALIDAVTSSQE